MSRPETDVERPELESTDPSPDPDRDDSSGAEGSGDTPSTSEAPAGEAEAASPEPRRASRPVRGARRSGRKRTQDAEAAREPAGKDAKSRRRSEDASPEPPRRSRRSAPPAAEGRRTRRRPVEAGATAEPEPTKPTKTGGGTKVKPVELLVIRHAIAQERETFAKTGKDDGLRPLTSDGAKRMKRAARGLLRIHPSLDLLASSPLVRAAQTAEIVADTYGRIPVETVAALSPEGSRSDLLQWLNDSAHRKARRIAVVGHEPSLSKLVNWLLSDQEESRLELKKGAACLLRFAGRPGPGGATLVWALAPSHLRLLAKDV